MTTVTSVQKPWIVAFPSSYSKEVETSDCLKEKVNDCVVSSEFNITHMMIPSKKKKQKVMKCLLSELKITFECLFGHTHSESAEHAFNVTIECKPNRHLFMHCMQKGHRECRHEDVPYVTGTLRRKGISVQQMEHYDNLILDANK